MYSCAMTSGEKRIVMHSLRGGALRATHTKPLTDVLKLVFFMLIVLLVGTLLTQ